jgi:hypothetical protein
MRPANIAGRKELVWSSHATGVSPDRLFEDPGQADNP